MIINRILLYIAGGVGLVLLLALGVQTWRLSSAKEALKEEQQAHATCRAQRELQNEMVEALRREGEQATQRATQARQQARQQAELSRASIEALRRSGARVRAPGEPCTISPELSSTEGL